MTRTRNLELGTRNCRNRRWSVVPRSAFRVPSFGFTLLEVILALAILVGALAVLGELADQGLTNARTAAASAEAQLLCESKLAEVTAGLVPLSAVSGATVETDPNWLYSITIDQTLDQGLIVVRVTVYENLPAAKRPTEFTLSRWMIDPSYAAEQAAVTETETN